jgi:hypothetical protein
VLIAFVPYTWTVFVSDSNHSVTVFYWQLLGASTLAALVTAGCALLIRRRGRGFVRRHPGTIFLVGWLAIELAVAVVLTPFPAARRVMSVAIVGGLVAGRAASRFGRIDASRRPADWCITAGIALGVAVAAIDVLDAFPEQSCAERAAERTADRSAGSTVWFAGHWGFQYYCERAGMKQLIPGKTELMEGDLLVLPEHPDPVGFYRPHISRPILPTPWLTERIHEIANDDPFAAQTIPNYYGGMAPVVGRYYPRLRVGIYRVTGRWVPGSWW